MRRETCLFIILVNLFCIYAQCPWTASGVKYWSNPATWPGNVVPYSGTVTIPSGTTVVYDITVSGNLFTGIVVPSGSKLVFDGTKDVILETNYVHVQFNGAFLIGTESCPFPKKATITLTGPKDTTTSISGMGNKAIINAGTLEFFGVPPKPTWTRVAATVNVNATSFTVQDTLTNWKAGETIFLASTDYYQELSERLKIVSVSGKTVTVDRPINYLHYGANNQFAEVGYMTRNILIQGDSIYSDLSSYGGHVINFGNASGRIYGVEFNRMGQRGIIGRYPFHYHVMLDQTGKGHYVNESSFHDSFQRCLTVHGTSGISVQNNVAFNITGHCYFLEEGSETNNFYNHNLGAWINPSTMIPTDNKPSVFWITNPNNTFINNAAVGGTFGFWFSMPARPLGLTAYQTWIYPRFTPLGKFENNVAHSAQSNGVHCDGGPNASGVEENFGYSPLVPPHTTSTQTYNTEEVRAFFTNTNAYKNRGYGMWMKGNYLTVENSLLQDNSAGVNTPGSNNLVQYTTIVGETDNIGTPGFTRYFNDFGRSRPRLWAADWRIRGWEAYDNGGGQFARNLTFVNFTSNSIRDAGALSALPSGPFNNPPTDILTETTMKNSNIFVINSYGGDNDGPKHVVLQDADGSITGSYGSFVTSNNTILLYNHNCTKKVEWNGFYHCQSSEHGFSNIEVRNTNTGASDFGDSLTKAVRATWVPFGQSSIKNTIQGGSVDGKIRTSYTSNVISRKGYVLQFPHPTPPQLQVNLRYAATGEWIVLALSYPATATFTITRGYSKIPLTNVTSLSGLSSSTYFFDKNTQYLYVMYFEDNGKVEGPMGFPMYGYGESYVDITASCGNQCQPTIVQSIPATYNPGEDNYRAKLQGCGAGTPSSNEGKAFFNYNSKTKRVTYIIYHNIPRATTAKITGSKGTVFEFPVAQSPIRGGFSISWDKHNDLWNGNWTIKIESANPSQAIGGKIGCFGTCSVPPSISSWNPCTKINKEHVLSGDGLNTTIGWADWSWGSNRSFVYTADKLCETTATWVNFYPWSSLTMHMGIGDCAPGSCSASWQKPYLNISSFSHFQFAARSPTGPLINVPLSVRAADHKGTYLSAFKQVSFNYISNYVVEDSWTRIKIPLADLGFKGNELVGIFSIAMNGGSGATPVLFDEIKLVPNFSDPNNRAPSGVVKNYSETC